MASVLADPAIDASLALLTANPEERAEWGDAESGWLEICLAQPPPP